MIATGGLPGTGGTLPYTGGIATSGGSPGTGGQATGGVAGTGGSGGEPEEGCNCSVPGSERRVPWLLLSLIGFMAARSRRRLAR